MERIGLELDEKTRARARELAETRHCSLDQLIKDFIEQGTKPVVSTDTAASRTEPSSEKCV